MAALELQISPQMVESSLNSSPLPVLQVKTKIGYFFSYILSDLIFNESLGSVLTTSHGLFNENSIVDYTCFACYYAHSWHPEEGTAW